MWLERLGVKSGEEHSSLRRRPDGPVDAQSEFSGRGQAGILMILHRQPAVAGISFFSGQSAVVPAHPSSFPSLSCAFIHRVPSIGQTDSFIVGSGGFRAPDLHQPFLWYQVHLLTCFCKLHEGEVKGSQNSKTRVSFHSSFPSTPLAFTYGSRGHLGHPPKGKLT